MRCTPTRFMLAAAPVLLAISPARADPSELLSAVPFDAWAVLVITPDGPDDAATQSRPHRGALDTAAFIFDQARRMGLVQTDSSSSALWMDAIASLPLITRHAFALCALHAEAEPLPGGGSRLAGLRAALIVRTHSNHGAIEARIQHMLNTYVNSEVATVDRRGDGPTAVYRLTDRRLPEWSRFEWGQLGDNYLITIGLGTFDRIASTLAGKVTSLGKDTWFSSAYRGCKGNDAVAAWTFRFDAIRKGLAPVMEEQPGHVLEAMGLAKVDRGLWTVGNTGRAVEALVALRRDGEDVFQPICRAGADPWTEKVVPPQATAYAIIERRPDELVRMAADAYLASRSPSNQELLRRMWAQVRADTDIDVYRDLLTQLGDRFAIHDYPQHPLHLPLARTIVAEITGSAMAARLSVDRLLRRWQQDLENPESGGSFFKLEKANDGVWFMQAGIYGPAVAVTEHWLVISYSPSAVRQNLELLEPAATTSRVTPPEPPSP